MGRNILLGFAGPGETSETNIDDLLGDYLEKYDDVQVVIPASEAALTRTVRMLLDWTVDCKIPYEVVFDAETRKNRRVLGSAKAEHETKNVGMGLIDRLAEGDGDDWDVALIVAWGEEGDDFTENLVDLAHAHDIKVLDITAGLDDKPLMEELTFEGEKEPEEEKPRRRTAKDKSLDPEPEEDQPRPRRGRPRTTTQTTEVPAEGAEPESVEAEVAQARQRAQKATETQPQAKGDDVILHALLQARALVTGLDACHAAMTLREDREPSDLYVLLGKAIAKYTQNAEAKPEPADEPEEKPEPAPRPRGGGRPRKDGTPARAGNVRPRTEWQDEDGDWHLAGKGRLPKGTVTRKVDPKTGDVIED